MTLLDYIELVRFTAMGSTKDAFRNTKMSLMSKVIRVTTNEFTVGSRDVIMTYLLFKTYT